MSGDVGKLEQIQPSGAATRAEIRFTRDGRKTLILEAAPIQLLTREKI